MSSTSNSLEIQIYHIEAAMKKAGVWSNEVPDWINHFTEDSSVDIWQWLQFIHLPMRIKGIAQNSRYLAPQLIEHMKDNSSYQQILQLVIELDAISPTLDIHDHAI